MAWDGDRFVELTRDLPRQRVTLRDIREIDEPYWSNEGTKSLSCRDVVEHGRLVLDCDFTYPILNPITSAFIATTCPIDVSNGRLR